MNRHSGTAHFSRKALQNALRTPVKVAQGFSNNISISKSYFTIFKLIFVKIFSYRF